MPPERFTLLTTANKDELSQEDRKIRQSIQWIGDALLHRRFHEVSSELSEATRALQAVATGFFDNLQQTKNEALLLLAMNQEAPLVMWHTKRSPATVPHSDRFGSMGVNCGVLALPKGNAHAGISIWGGLTHENGHHIVDGIPKLMENIKGAVEKALDPKGLAGIDEHFRKHFVASSKEIACDVLALLDGGPAFVLSLLSTLEAERGGTLSCRGSYFGDDKAILKDLVLIEGKNKLAVSTGLSDVQIPGESGVFGRRILPRKRKSPSAASVAAKSGDEEPVMRYRKFKYSDGHPVDVSRVLVLQALLNKIATKPELKGQIDAVIDAAIDKAMGADGMIRLEYVDYEADGTTLVVKQHEYPIGAMRRAAVAIGDAIAHTKFEALNEETLCEVFPWAAEDNLAVENLQEQLSREGDLATPPPGGTKALTSYILSAAILNSCKEDGNVERAFARMKKFLVQVADRPQEHAGAGLLV
ncbi:MAG: hypothetical protein P0S96_01900 [Simkaniaceae bacterium]|nr:hypothetical protein [Candidatus Sacchlamyda saccharinae]